MSEPGTRTLRLNIPVDDDQVSKLQAGDLVLLTGYMFTGRDAAHKRMWEAIQRGEDLPFDPRGQAIYYVGPCPARPGEVIGPAGPTTSGRMDKYSPDLLDLGLKIMIGKGKRSPEVIKAIVRNKAAYLCAVGGAAVLIAQSIKRAEVWAYEDLGPEAVYRLYVRDFPAFVVVDSSGACLYDTEPPKYAR